MALPAVSAIAAPTEQLRELTADPKEVRRMSADMNQHAGYGARQWGFQSRLLRGVTLEEYQYWAKVERELEAEEFRAYKASQHSAGFMGTIKSYFTSNAYEDAKKKNQPDAATKEAASAVLEKGGSGSDTDDPIPVPPRTENDLDAEWRKASRALRTAGWGAVFYLITTDILGWGQTPYVFANTGYGLGVGIFFLMGLAAGVSGFMIWRTFLALDSSRYPMLTFGDPFFRLVGPKTRHFVNVLQSLQMFFSVAVVLLGQTNIVAQLGETANLCFVVAGVISLVVSMVSGYMRALKHLGWFCNAAVWLNLASFVCICVSAGLFFPDVVPQVTQSLLPKTWVAHPVPVATFAGAPPDLYQPTDHNLFAAKFNGINSMVYAYSGAVLFIAFLSEMRHPWDFWKSMLCAQTFISVIYIFFGAYTYSRWGQYSFGNINQVVRPLGLQIFVNVLSLLTGWLAVFLYFNVGMKTVYVEVLQEVCKFPAITTSKGKKLWWGVGPIYWILAFIVALSIPQFNAFVNFIGGLFSLNFTYSFSGIMYWLYLIQDGASLPGEGFDPATGQTTRHDSGMKRWIRGYRKNLWLCLGVQIYFMCGLASSGMGSWAGIEGLIGAFSASGSETTSWSCHNPYHQPSS